MVMCWRSSRSLRPGVDALPGSAELPSDGWGNRAARTQQPGESWSGRLPRGADGWPDPGRSPARHISSL